MGKKLFGLGLSAILFLFIYFPLFAADPPPGQGVGAQGERFKNESELERQRLERKKTKVPPIQFKERAARPAAAGASFFLKEIKITGATIFNTEELRPTYASYLNKKVTFADLETITKNIKAKYAQKGYVTSSAYIPAQDIKEGKIEIKVMEGKMGKLKVEGNRWFSSELLEKYFHSKKNEILDVNKLQRDILRLNMSSDLEVKTVISAGEEEGTSDITLKAKENFPWHAGFNQDNQGTRLTGKWRSAVSLRSSNATGHLDSLFDNSLFSSDSFGEFVSYTLPLTTYGTKFGMDATYFNMRLGKEFKASEIYGNTQIYSPHFSWELALEEDYQANTEVGMDIKCIKKKQDGSQTSDDQLRMPYFSFNFTKTDSFAGQTSFSPRFSFGTSGFLGASSRNHPSASREGTGGSFFKYEHSLSRIQRMPFSSYCLIRSQLLASSHTLPSSEQFQLGGESSIRGYPEGDYLADFGGDLNFDWIFPCYIIPKDWKLPGQQVALREQIEPVIFTDIGGGELKKVLPGELHDKFLAGVGGGFRIRWGKNISLRLEWAKSVGDRPTSGSGPSSFYFTFQSET